MKKIIFTVGLLSMTTACAPTTQTPNVSTAATVEEARIQREIAVKEIMDDRKRLNRVADKIMLANAQLCGDQTTAYTGINLASTDRMDDDFAQTYQTLYGIEEQPTVILVTPGSPASGKMKTGDMVLAVNGKPVKSGDGGIEQVIDSHEEIQGGAITYTIDRAGKQFDVSVNSVTSCNFGAYVAAQDEVNAFADGENVFVTKGMMRFAENDNELALVIGHELAHNSREHMDSKRGNAIVGGILGAVVSVAIGIDVTDLGAQIGAGAYSQGFESEADYVGLYHTARAGYSIDKAPYFWRRMAASNPQAIHIAGSSHPSTAARFVALEESVKEIKSKKARGAALIPEEAERQAPEPREAHETNG